MAFLTLIPTYYQASSSGNGFIEIKRISQLIVRGENTEVANQLTEHRMGFISAKIWQS